MATVGLLTIIGKHFLARSHASCASIRTIDDRRISDNSLFDAFIYWPFEWQCMDYGLCGSSDLHHLLR